MHFTEKDFFIRLKYQKKKPRIVPAFSIQSYQKNTIVKSPPKCNPYKIRPVKNTLFQRLLENGEIPILKTNQNPLKIEKTKKHEEKNLSLQWLEKPENLDYCYHFPIMIEGLADSSAGIRIIAETAAKELIIKNPKKVLPTIPFIILPIKNAMNTRDPEIIMSILKVIQYMVKNVPCAGQALIPYFRQILPICNLFKHINVNLLDGIDEERDKRIGDVIEDTLQVLEQCGGRDAYINIRYVIPTYESCVMN